MDSEFQTTIKGISPAGYNGKELLKAIDELFKKGSFCFEVTDLCNARFDLLIAYYNESKKSSVNIDSLRENELTKCKYLRDGTMKGSLLDSLDLTDITTEEMAKEGFYNNLDLTPFFRLGWSLAESGDFSICWQVLRDEPEICEEIKRENLISKESTLPLLDNVVRVMINGMAYAKYYYWLKEQQNDKPKPEIEKPEQEIPSIVKIVENKTKWQETIHNYYYLLTKQQRSRSLFIPFGDVYILPRLLRNFHIAVEKNWFDEDINLEKETNNYANGFKTGYFQFKEEVNNPILYKDAIFEALENIPYDERPVRRCNYEKKIKPYRWEVYGELVGKYYYAWCEVLKNQTIFKPLFNIRTFTKRKVDTFTSLFRYSDNAKKVKEILQTHDYIDKNGQWVGLTKNKTELLSAYYVLLPILIPGNSTPRATIFYNEFGLKVGEYISGRSLRSEPKNQGQRKEFERIFSSILPKE